MQSLKIFIISVFLLHYCHTHGQKLEWLNTVEGDIRPSFPSDLALDNENNSYLIGDFGSSSVGFTRGTFQTIIKYNESGHKCWYKNLKYNIVALNAEDDSCNLYSVIVITDSITIGGTKFLKPKGDISIILMKSDSAFNIKYTRLITDSAGFNNGPAGVSAKILAKGNQILLNITLSATPASGLKGYFFYNGKNYTDTYSTPTWGSAVNYFMKLEKNNVNASASEWISVLYNQGVSYILRNIRQDDNGNFYALLGNLSSNVYYNDSAVMYGGGWAVVKFSVSTGKLVSFFSMSGQFLSFSDFLITPSGKIFLCGSFGTSFNYGSVSLSSANTSNGFFLFLENDGAPIWALKEDNSLSGGNTFFTKVGFNNGNIYISGYYHGGLSTKIGDFTLYKGPVNLSNNMSVKLDTLGNCLWAYLLTYNTSNIAPHMFLGVDLNGHSLFAGYFQTALAVLDTSVTLLQGQHAYIYKISDYAIWRGNVYPGPYCAGDTIDIPYKLVGEFNSGNEFIAQLSDEDGNFSGGERELGRLKAYKDSVIKGVLPLFSVISSGKYRIRILSTIPGAQSYYRQDTLRLLIYSRDTANAGPDTTICLGQKIQLKTTGGSKWEWTPTATLNNPATYKPVASPVTDTEYRIIISDSSGCGDIDTDYVKVYVKQPLKLSVNNDTTICYKGIAMLKAVAKDGKPAYKLTWLDDAGMVVDSSFTTPVSPLVTTVYTAILTDNCPQPDTQKVRVTVKPPLSIIINSDDSICLHKQVLLNAVISGGDSVSRSFQWNEINSSWTSTSPVFPVFPKVNTTYYAKLSDNCSPPVTDSLVVTVLPVPIANFEVNFVNGCPPVMVNFTDNSTGNDTLLNVWKILPAEAPGVKTHTHPFYTGGNYNFGLIVSNKFGCTDDTSRNVRVEVFPKPTASFFIKPEIKEVEGPLLLYNTSQNGNTYTWDFGNGATLKQNSRNDTTFTYTDSGTYTIHLIAENDKGCRDTTRQTIRVFDKIWCTIPNAFTPNGDGLNPLFAPVCVGVAEYTLAIYNRWGQVLYNCENCAWDGTYDGTPVIDGVYMYKIDLKGESRRKSTVYGTVNVLR